MPLTSKQANRLKISRLEFTGMAKVKNVVAAWREAHIASKDTSRYWSDTKQAFKALPMTKEERENIEKRNQRFCEVSINPAKMREATPWIFPFLIPQLQEIRKHKFQLQPLLDL